jgi:hypothetical protein
MYQKAGLASLAEIPRRHGTRDIYCASTPTPQSHPHTPHTHKRGVGCKALASSLALAQIARLRDYFTSHLKWRRIIEPCVLAALYTTGCMVLPLFFPCTPTTCVVDEVGE